MELGKACEPTPEWSWIEVGKAGRKLVEEVFPIKNGENVVITADSRSDWRVVTEVVKAIYSTGGIPTLIVHPTTGEASTDPPSPVAGALQQADAWIELNDSYLLYSDAWKKAMEAGVRFFAGGGDVEILVNMIGRIDYPLVDKFANKLLELTNKATEVTITSDEGTNLRIKVDPKGSIGHYITGDSAIKYDGAGTLQVMPGQATFGHIPDSVNGTLVFDGFLWPPNEINVLKETVGLEISKGKIVKVIGGRTAETYTNFLANFNHPGVYEIAHCTYGFNPGCERTKGQVDNDERIFGCMEFGIGPKWADSPMHMDGSMLKPSVWADGVQLEERGRYVHPELVELCKQMHISGY